jgi:UMF1 family MFS transporter
MGIALVGFVQPEVPWFGMSTEEGFNVRATNLLVAVWYGLFALPLFLFVPDRRMSQIRLDVRGSIRELSATLREIARFREIVKFLVARLVFNDGLVTVFAFGGIYAAGTFGMSLSEVIAFGVVLNIAAGLGALIFGFVDDRIGGKQTIMVTLVALSIATAMAVWAPNRSWFWIAGILIGIFVGPNQSASRSLMARFVPENRQAEFFGFFAFSGKVTSFAGPILLGTVTSLFQSQRAGVATVVFFFVVGGLLMLTVHERRGIEAAKAGSTTQRM